MLKSKKWRLCLALYFVAMNALLLFFIYSISDFDRLLANSYEIGAYEHLKAWIFYVLLGNAYILLLAILLVAIILSLRFAAKLMIRLCKSPTARQSSKTETGKR